jgi:hypothetical protein
MAPLQVWFVWQIVPPIPAQVFDITTVPPATSVGVTAFCAGVVAYDGIKQVPAQHFDESVVLIRSPEQVSSARQMWPPVSAQVSATDATAVCCVGITETTAPVVCAAPTRVAVGTAVSPACVVCAAPTGVAVGTAVSPACVVCAASRVAVGTGVSPGAAGVASSVAVGTTVRVGVDPCVADWAGVFPGFRKAHPAINTKAITMRMQVPVPMYIRFINLFSGYHI